MLKNKRVAASKISIYTGKKVLVICSTLDLDLPYGATPMIWQLLKGLYEAGCDLIVVPYRGRAFRSPWWKCYPTPARLEGDIFAKTYFNKKSQKVNKSFVKNKLLPQTIRSLILPRWFRLLKKIKENDGNLDAAVIIGIPLNQITGLSDEIKKLFNCPVAYYELDVPTSLPRFGGFSFNYFEDSDLTEYDLIFSPSEGVVDDLKELGAKHVEFLHFGVDPDLFRPIKIDQPFDVFFYGTNDYNREKTLEMMVKDPSEQLEGNFIVSGIKFKANIGKARHLPLVPFNKWRNYACGSKINLNIPRENHALTYATSTSRPFELAAMGCCVVSSPYNGLENWFKIGEEMFISHDSSEAIDLYSWLLKDESARNNAADKARQRVLSEHTYAHRACQLVQAMKL